jgi:type III secretion protein D
MDNAVATRDSLQSLELRVFEGPQSGAKAPLAAGAGFVLAANPFGHAEGADVVLREEGVAPARVRVTVDMHDALLEVLEGEVHIGDKVLAAGTQAPWAMHAPLKIGRSVVAFGRSALANWPGSRTGSAAQPDAENSTTPAARKPRTPLGRRPEVWLAAMGGAVLLICGAAFGTAQLAAAPRTDSVAAPSLATALKASEFSTLQIGARKDGQPELRGRLETLEQRARLDTWLAARQFTPVVDVQVDEVLVRDVTETFRVNGVSVQAQVLGAGTVAAEAAERDPDRLARAEEVVRRDVRGLTKLAVRNTAQPPRKPLPPTTDDPGKRIASLVPGDPAYLVTADGSRYFVGSMLPSGFRIAEIAANSVTLEHDGEQTTLNF